MKMNKKGEGGFMEAIMAVMIVTVSLTAFMGFLSYSDLGALNDDSAIDVSFVRCLAVDDGVITGSCAKEMENAVCRNGYSGMALDAWIAGTDSDFRETVGITDGMNADSVSGTLSVTSGDGRTYAVCYEVVYWWD